MEGEKVTQAVGNRGLVIERRAKAECPGRQGWTKSARPSTYATYIAKTGGEGEGGGHVHLRAGRRGEKVELLRRAAAAGR